MDNQTCTHCGATDVGSPAAGFARGAVTTVDDEVVGAVLCHPNTPGRPDCYRLVTLYNHPMPCTTCTRYRIEKASWTPCRCSCHKNITEEKSA